jgi:hypothetical protein
LQPSAIPSADLVTRISFPVTFSVLGILGLTVITAAYGYSTQSLKDTLVFFSVGAAAVGQITASFYTARMLGATLAIRRDDLDQQRKRSALQFGSRWNDADMYLVRDVLREVIDHAGSHEDLIQIIEGKRTHVIHVLNFLEEIAITKRSGLSDPDLLRTQFAGVVTAAWATTFPWVQAHRRKRALPSLWEDLESLYAEWR